MKVKFGSLKRLLCPNITAMPIVMQTSNKETRCEKQMRQWQLTSKFPVQPLWHHKDLFAQLAAADKSHPQETRLCNNGASKFCLMLLCMWMLLCN